MIQKRWFHATTKENWEAIKKEGILFGKGYNTERETYLARNLDELIRMINLPLFGDLRKCKIILSVKYTPNKIDDDYNPKEWEMIVYKPILLQSVKILKYI